MMRLETAKYGTSPRRSRSRSRPPRGGAVGRPLRLPLPGAGGRHRRRSRRDPPLSRTRRSRRCPGASVSTIDPRDPASTSAAPVAHPRSCSRICGPARTRGSPRSSAPRQGVRLGPDCSASRMVGRPDRGLLVRRVWAGVSTVGDDPLGPRAPSPCAWPRAPGGLRTGSADARPAAARAPANLADRVVAHVVTHLGSTRCGSPAGPARGADQLPLRKKLSAAVAAWSGM